ncbi:MAG: YbhB/YbcL family Raf kinase inhibitor-like protein [Scytolyngbya sp. HA4215-MV1]|nr:YbhB/YbcL family Raf kinase inhibitor-like protein [Scytolyngbya sp. HA4215-MV1]
MKLESPAFTSGSLIPPQFTCDGQDMSPPLRWEAPPPNTHSFVLICDDPDAPFGIFVHWLVYNLPPDVRELSQAFPVQPTLPNGASQGKNGFGKLGYGGPCPPRGTHRYFFRLYALDTQLSLKPGVDKATLEKAMQQHVLAVGEWMGRYTRQK